MSGCCRIDPIHHRGIYIPAVATPRCPFPSRRPFFPDLPFLSIGRPQLASRGCFSLARTLMPPLFWGALARSLPFSLSLSLPRNPPSVNFQPSSHFFSSFVSHPFHPRDVSPSLASRTPMQPAIVYTSNLNYARSNDDFLSGRYFQIRPSICIGSFRLEFISQGGVLTQEVDISWSRKHRYA